MNAANKSKRSRFKVVFTRASGASEAVWVWATDKADAEFMARVKRNLCEILWVEDKAGNIVLR